MAIVESAAMEKAQNTMTDKVCAQLDQSTNDDASAAKVRNRDLSKTKLCFYHVQGKCGLGINCPYAHSASEVRKAPNLTKTQLCTNFMNGKCTRANCSYAHGEAELVKPPSFKKKLCAWYKQGNCRNGNNCGFVHNLSELCVDANAKKKHGKEDDSDETSTAVPSSQSQVESDRTGMSTTTHSPEERIFRMMAGRGSAPLDHQVKSIGLAINGLQAKLSQVQGHQSASGAIEGATLQGMQDAINQLSSQCDGMEASLRTKQQAAPTALQPPVANLRTSQQPVPPWSKARSNTSASHQKTLGINDDKSDASQGAPSQVKKARPTTQPSLLNKLETNDYSIAAISTKSLRSFGLRGALCVLVFALMVMVELQQFTSE